ncbi:hypothetical protein EVAR_18741_1 [Eumeta japonica]|uniref:Uncharacterized protein n=1 Tax=Eumeta variegata TaxID=151549 RepID=A0A4C1UM92_EUMVA|nr:hypothetical protein EVAR_18741_1 [Eumeta japonica]
MLRKNRYVFSTRIRIAEPPNDHATRAQTAEGRGAALEETLMTKQRMRRRSSAPANLGVADERALIMARTASKPLFAHCRSKVDTEMGAGGEPVPDFLIHGRRRPTHGDRDGPALVRMLLSRTV